jgi:hypothetical protein
MSIEFKMTRYGSGRKSRLYKKTKRASINRIDATHLPMRVQSEKHGYWGQTSRGRASLPYIKVKKFLLANVGRPVNKVYTEFLASARKHKQVENLERVFNSFIDRCDKYRRWGVNCSYYTSNRAFSYVCRW